MNPSIPGASLAVFSLALLQAAQEAAPVLRRWQAKGWIWFTAAGLSGEEFEVKKRRATARAAMSRLRARRRAEQAVGLAKAGLAKAGLPKAGLPKAGGCVLAGGKAVHPLP